MENLIDSVQSCSEEECNAIFDPWDNLSNASDRQPESGETLERVMDWFSSKGIMRGQPCQISQRTVQEHRKRALLTVRQCCGDEKNASRLCRRLKQLSLSQNEHLVKSL